MYTHIHVVRCVCVYIYAMISVCVAESRKLKTKLANDELLLNVFRELNRRSAKWNESEIRRLDDAKISEVNNDGSYVLCVCVRARMSERKEKSSIFFLPSRKDVCCLAFTR